MPPAARNHGNTAAKRQWKPCVACSRPPGNGHDAGYNTLPTRSTGDPIEPAECPVRKRSAKSVPQAVRVTCRVASRSPCDLGPRESCSTVDRRRPCPHVEPVPVKITGRALRDCKQSAARPEPSPCYPVPMGVGATGQSRILGPARFVPDGSRRSPSGPCFAVPGLVLSCRLIEAAPFQRHCQRSADFRRQAMTRC
jgi:hypothetical protein